MPFGWSDKNASRDSVAQRLRLHDRNAELPRDREHAKVVTRQRHRLSLPTQELDGRQMQRVECAHGELLTRVSSQSDAAGARSSDKRCARATEVSR